MYFLRIRDSLRKFSNTTKREADLRFLERTRDREGWKIFKRHDYFPDARMEMQSHGSNRLTASSVA